MTTKEFWDRIDRIDIDSRDTGRYTEEEIFSIGCAFIKLDNSQKREVGGWDRLVKILKPLGQNGKIMKSGEQLRGWIKAKRYEINAVPKNIQLLSGKTIGDITYDEFEEEVNKQKRELYKQQVKTRDERNSYRRTVRDEARIESLKDCIKDTVYKLSDLPKFENTIKIENPNEDVEAVMLISDLHIGMEIDNYFNKYNVDIAKARLEKYVDETIAYCNKFNVSRLNVCNLGDLIHGLIHVTGRIEEQEDIIEQIMVASELLANALNKLSSSVKEVVYRSVTDNHSRAVADFKQHIEKENFSRIIDFYLKARLQNKNVIFAEDNLDWDISLINLKNGKKMICSHGHKDGINTILQGYIGATREFIEYVCVGHFHESKMKSFQGAKVFVNGCICGADSYAQSKRLYGVPEQSLLIFEGNNLIVNYINLDIK